MFLGDYPSKIRMIFAIRADANATGMHHHPQYSEEKSPAHQDRQTGQCRNTTIGRKSVFSANFLSHSKTYSPETMKPAETAVKTMVKKTNGVIFLCCFFG